MTTETRPDPPDSSVIVGEDLEQSLVDAGVTEPHARALRAAVELIVLRLRGSVATKDDLAAAKGDLKEDLAAAKGDLKEDIATVKGDLKEDIATVKRDLKEDLATVKRDLQREIDGLRREMRWGFFLMITIFGGLLIALLTRTF